MNYFLHLVIYFDIFVILSLSLNLLVGHCGLLTLAHSSFFAIGAYSYAILSCRYALDFFLSSVIGSGVAATSSLFISVPARRLRGDFFMSLSIAVQVLLYTAIYNWHSYGRPLGTISNLTNGPYGIAGIPRPTLFGYEVGSTASIAALYTAIAVLVAVICWRLARSPWGRLLEAIRDDELAARGIGKDSDQVKSTVLAISCALAAMSGSMYAGYVGYIDPSVASLGESILVLCMILIGGTGNFVGPVFGTFILLGIPEFLRLFGLPEVQAANVRLLIFGFALILVVHFRPRGLMGSYAVE